MEELAARLRRNWRFRVWELPLEPEGFWEAWPEAPPETRERGAVTYREAVEGVVRVYAAAHGLPVPEVWVDHTPGNVRDGNTLLDLFPDARLIHLVRDGRAVAGSVTPLDWGPNTVWAVTDWWPLWLAFGLALETARSDRVIRVGFEALVRRPREVLGRICPRLGLDPEEDFGRQTAFRTPGFTKAQHALVDRPPDPARADAWRETLSAREVEVFESSAGDLLRSLGYALEHGRGARRPSRAEKWGALLRGWLRAGENLVQRRRRQRGIGRDGRRPIGRGEVARGEGAT